MRSTNFLLAQISRSPPQAVKHEYSPFLLAHPMVNTIPQQTTAEPDRWNPPLPPTDLIFDDGESLETNQHRVAMNVLIRSYQKHCAEQTELFLPPQSLH